MEAPYDSGYASCPCFWGREPGSLVLRLAELIPSWRGLRVLDVGCGEGKNAAFLAERGAVVKAIDFSSLALRNARAAWPAADVTWELADVRSLQLEAPQYDIVLAYGLLHCLLNEIEVEQIVGMLQRATVLGGFNVVCAFNDRAQDLSAHPGFEPVLLSHDAYLALYKAWRLTLSTDSDLSEVHPHNGILHTHSMSRLIAQKTQNDRST